MLRIVEWSNGGTHDTKDFTEKHKAAASWVIGVELNAKGIASHKKLAQPDVIIVSFQDE